MNLVKYFVCACLVGGVLVPARAQESTLTVDQIMQDPDKWVGAWPSSPRWSEDGRTLYFDWNPAGLFPGDSLFKVGRGSTEPVMVSPAERRSLEPMFDGWHHGAYVYDRFFDNKVYERDGDLYLYNRATRTTTRLTHTTEAESDPHFLAERMGVVYRRGDNLFVMEPMGGTWQITDLRRGEAPAEAKEPEPLDAFLQAQQERLFEVLRRRKTEREQAEAERERDKAARGLPKPFYVGNRRVEQLRLDPLERYVTFVLVEDPADPRRTSVPEYVTESGYAGAQEARPKVGSPLETRTFYVQDLARDTTYQVDLSQLPGAFDVPAYLREQGVAVDSSRARRFYIYGPFWSPDGRYAVVEVRAMDNKDRWIARLDPATGRLTVLDRQHDEAWVAGPGIEWAMDRSELHWHPQSRWFYFQSEKTGYSHLYRVDVETGEVQQLTSGAFEVSEPMLSRDGRTVFFQSNEGSPFERHFYRMPADGGERTRLTTMAGLNDVALAPDETAMGILHSYTNRPPEIYVHVPSEEPVRVTDSPSSAWRAYPWREGEIIHFEASDGVPVPAQLFVPEQPNGAAVLFVHGAGYLQNVHRGWSSYFREYMFHNLLTDLGYYVMNVDYRGSAGYGRDWRTAVYRHMGGRDLQDYVDASRHLQQTYGIDPERVFIYGGSYGGFITLMALFTEPEHFGGGAALRSVTDWAHYNHPYTANILNTPAEDSLAIARSSPIYFAEGLEDPLLIAHGMVDVNVHFQDVVRLVQRLIELRKENWELAVYPVEDHAFAEPESWADEYKRILKYIKLSVGPREAALEEVPLLKKEEERRSGEE